MANRFDQRRSTFLRSRVGSRYRAVNWAEKMKLGGQLGSSIGLLVATLALVLATALATNQQDDGSVKKRFVAGAFPMPEPRTIGKRRISTRWPSQQQPQPPGELLFSNSTGAVVQCGVAQELADAIARTDSKLNSGSNQLLADPFKLSRQTVKVRWEKESGEEVEQTVYSSVELLAGSQSNIPPIEYSSVPSSSSSQSSSSSALSASSRRPLRFVRQSDGALVFEPFSPQDFQPDVHASSYRCVAFSPSRGASLVSTDMRARAVLAAQSASGAMAPQPAQVEVLDELVIEGNNAHFRCQLASQALDYLQVVEWVEYPSETLLTYQSTTLANAAILFQSANVSASPPPPPSRYYMSPRNGDLHIINVDASLNYRSYKCRCRNKLTGELVSSANRGKLIVTESHSPMAPRIVAGADTMTLSSSRAAQEEGELGMLACNAQAYPRASISWYRRVAAPTTGAGGADPVSEEWQPISSGGPALEARHVQVAGGLLLISRLNRNDSGAYLCVAKNAAGEERVQLELLVRAKLRAKLRASASVLELGKSLALDCTVTGFPIHQVVFRHNQDIIKSITGPAAGGGIGATQSTTTTYRAPAGHHYNNQQQRHRGGNYFVVDSSSPANRPAGAQSEAPLNAMDSSDPETTDDYLDNEPSDDEPNDGANRLSHVIVIVLEPQHAGAYQCFAYNQFESAQSSAYIRVLDDPPKFKDTFGAQVYEQQQDISLQCSARGNPLPEITWSVDEQPVPESARTHFGDYVTKDQLVISYVNISQTQVTDSGLYKCTADNGLAQITHQAQISVAGPLQVKPMANATVVASTSLRVRCPVAGHPVGEIQWQHNGRRLPANHRQHVYENGTLVVEHMEKAQADDGEYVCLVSPSLGQSPVAAGSLHLSIKARPTIEPFSISRSLREGQRASVTCTMSSGDLPISIHWFRNGQPLISLDESHVILGPARGGGETPQVAGDYTTNPLDNTTATTTALQGAGHQLVGVRISRLSDYASTLLFESLLAQHSGNYTCLARNDAGSVSHEAPMVVQVAPKWSLEPADTNVIRGTSISVNCMAGGFPPPRIIWTKAAPDTPSGQQATTRDLAAKSHLLGSWRSIVSSPHLQVYENGSLNILEARDSDAGYYMCQAINGVGPGLSKVVKITINVAAQFSARHYVQYVVKGEHTHLKCPAKGDWPLSVHWFKDRHKLEPINPQESTAAASSSSSAPTPGGAGPAGSITLSSSVASVLMMSGHPSSQLKFNVPTGSYIEQQLSNLLLAQQQDATKHSKQQQQQSHQQSSSAGLLLQRYSLAISETALASSLTGSGAGANNNNRLISIGSSSGGAGEQHLQHFAQSAAADAMAGLGSTNGATTGNNRQPTNSNDRQQQPYVVQVNSVLSINQAERADTGTFKCIAANQFGLDERTIQLVVQEVPGRIEELSILEANSRSITLGWLAPYDGNSPIINYHVQYRAASNSAPVLASSQMISAETLNSLSWFNYTLNGSESSSSAISQAAPKQAPANLLQTAGSGRSLVKLTINSLKPITRYWFRVEAENKLGRGPVSMLIETSTAEEAPGAAPSRLKAVARSSSSILVSWSKLSDKEMFGRVHGYYVAYKPVVSAGDPSAANASSEQQTSVTNIYKTIQHDDKLAKFDALLTGLKRSTKYTISVQAFNARGTGPSTEPVTVRTLEMDPPRQVKLFVKQASNCSIQLEWRPLSQAALVANKLAASNHQVVDQGGRSSPASGNFYALPLSGTGGDKAPMKPIDTATSSADVVDYYSLFQAELNERPQWQETRLAGQASSHTIEGLRCGTRYQFYMMGANKVGVGEQSDILDTRTIGGLPLAPDRQSTFDVLNTTCYMIRLDHWQDNGCPIRAFNIRYRHDGVPGTKEPVGWTQLAHFNLPPADGQHGNRAIGSATNEPIDSPSSSKSTIQSTATKTFIQSHQVRRRRSVDGDSEGVYIFNMEPDAQDDEDSFLDYGVGGAGDDDYAAAASDSVEAANYSSDGQVQGADYDEQRSQSDTKLFNLLKDSMLPAFVESSSSSELIQPETSHLSERKASMLPPLAQQWQASNFVADTPDNNKDKDALSKTSRSPSASDWRRVKFCGLIENIYYSIQITATNAVGETEAELKLLTSQEGLEYDQEIKRQVVGKLGGDRAAQSIAMDRLTHMFPLSQWPVLVPITLTVILMTVIITLLIRRTHSSASGSSTTTTTTTTTRGGGGGGGGGSSNSSGGSAASHCQNYLNESHAGHSLTMGTGGCKHAQYSPGAPSAITEAATVGSEDMLAGNGLDVGANNYATAGRAHNGESCGGNFSAIYQRHRSNQSVVGADESGYGVVGLAQMFNGNTDSSSPSTTAVAPSLNSGCSGPNSAQQQYMGSRAMPAGGETISRGRNVYLCSAGNISKDDSALDQLINKPENIFYGVGTAANTELQQHELYGGHNNYATSRQIFQQQPGVELCAANQNIDDTNLGEGGKLDNCFMSIVEEVARANENLRQNGTANGTANPGEKLVESTGESNLCQQADCLNNQFNLMNNGNLLRNYTQTVRALVDGSSRQHQLQQALANVASNNNTVQGQANQLMYDPVYATIRRTFPQAFRYLTLQNQHHQLTQNNPSQQQHLQQVGADFSHNELQTADKMLYR